MSEEKQEMKDAADFANAIKLKSVSHAIAVIAKACEYMNWQIATPDVDGDDSVKHMVIGEPDEVEFVCDAYEIGKPIVQSMPDEVREALHKGNVEFKHIDEEEMDEIKEIIDAKKEITKNEIH